jgi:hypothetical protein
MRMSADIPSAQQEPETRMTTTQGTFTDTSGRSLGREEVEFLAECNMALAGADEVIRSDSDLLRWATSATGEFRPRQVIRYGMTYMPIGTVGVRREDIAGPSA